MTNYSKLKPDELEKLAYLYIQECINHKKDIQTSSGKIALISDRKIPTIDYFLRIWIPLQQKPTICRATYYNWLKSEDLTKLDTIKNIEAIFKALAIDIVANECKGIFYAKNRLGMTDKAQNELKFAEQPLFPDWLTDKLVN
jgi:hypothetical protein